MVLGKPLIQLLSLSHTLLDNIELTSLAALGKLLNKQYYYTVVYNQIMILHTLNLHTLITSIDYITGLEHTTITI